MSRSIACSTVSIPRALLNYLRKKEPSLFVHGNCWAVSAALCDRLKVKRLRTPREGKRAGGVNRRGMRITHSTARAATAAGAGGGGSREMVFSFVLILLLFITTGLAINFRHQLNSAKSLILQAILLLGNENLWYNLPR